MFDPGIFRMYDIRGVAGTQLDEDVARAVGRALGTRIVRAGGHDAAVGRDVRHSSPGLAAAAAEGLAACGLGVHDLGIVPTPVLYHALHRMDLGGGIMVTGSHNPKSDNGLKCCLGTAALYGDQVTTLRTQAEEADFVSGAGTVEPCDWLSPYLEEVCGMFTFSRPHKVAVDCGNGVMGPVVLEAFHRLGIEVEPLYCEPDGDFPNHVPDPEVPEYMRALGERVRRQECEVGLGFDGDGDRVGILDEQGIKLSADWLLALFARDVLAKCKGGKVRYDVKCSDFLADDIRAHGGEPVMGETGHSLLKRDMQAIDAVLGGELSGHIVFNREYVPIDDSLYCALRFLEILDESGGPTSALFRDFPQLVATAEIKVPCPDATKFEAVAGLVKHFKKDHDVIDIDGARVRLPGGTWFLVRASNTTPNLTVRFEGPTPEAVREAREVLLQALEAWPDVDRAALT